MPGDGPARQGRLREFRQSVGRGASSAKPETGSNGAPDGSPRPSIGRKVPRRRVLLVTTETQIAFFGRSKAPHQYAPGSAANEFETPGHSDPTVEQRTADQHPVRGAVRISLRDSDARTGPAAGRRHDCIRACPWHRRRRPGVPWHTLRCTTGRAAAVAPAGTASELDRPSGRNNLRPELRPERLRCGPAGIVSTAKRGLSQSQHLDISV